MRLGIMGGTFDPVHRGHLAIARAALKEAGLDEVRFLPDGDPPHKTPGAPGEDRLRMVRLAVRGKPGLTVSDMELRRQGRTYTVDTLLQLKREEPGRELFYVVGSDTLFLFPTWRTAERVAGLCRMLVALRPGDGRAEVEAQRRAMHERYGLVSELLLETGPDISSSQVREAVRRGEDLGALVPPAVARHILRRGLYRDETPAEGAAP